MKRTITFLSLLAVLVLLCYESVAQRPNDFIPQNSSHVHRYLLLAPGKMGPNALPVPEVGDALVGDQIIVTIGADGHYRKGDKAINSFLSLDFPIVADIISCQVWGYPSETFRMTNAIRDERQIYYDDTGTMTDDGDLWFGTSIQIFKDRKHLPDLMVVGAYKTTTGGLDHARYTDAPAHYYQFQLGKRIKLNSHRLKCLQLSGMCGMYVWQTNREEVSQDEGPLGGAEIRLISNKMEIYQSMAGYHAYEETGFNKPLVYRSGLQFNGKKMSVGLEYQTGNNDYKYQTFRFKLSWHFPTLYKAIKLSRSKED
ncbi:hypothetical protein EYV94_22440 [Puteibacter caeruleilacunae]|nr:hypothetical protein EYV94_22440 [Puteibacter caeruleilacunae]